MSASRLVANLSLFCTLFLLAPAAAAGAGSDGLTPPALSYTPGEVVGRLRLKAPEARSFILRGTMPVPPGIHPLAGGRTAFAVRGPDGVSVPAQVETVSRYASAEHGADVVEVLARVDRPVSLGPGTPLEYEVVFAPHWPPSFRPSDQVDALVEAGIHLETRDVFGHLYRADLLRDLRDRTSDLRILRNGFAAHQVRTHEILMPRTRVAGDQGTLPHHVAVHAYVTRWQGDEVVSVDLRIYNGGSGLDDSDPGDDPNAKIYFDRFTLRLPEGWRALSAFRDPFRGPDITSGDSHLVSLVAPLPGGKLHMMPAQAYLSRRLILYRHGHVEAARSIVQEQTLAFCTDGTTTSGRRAASWWNPQTPRYFAQREPLPRLDALDLVQMEAVLEERFQILRDTLSTGKANPWPFYVMNEVLGWAHPYGHAIGYAHGGEEIHFFSGVDVAFLASTAGYRTFQLRHRMYNARHATTLYDANGDPTRLESWLVSGGPAGHWNPAWVWIKPVLWLGDPFGFNAAPTFQVAAVAAMGKQPYYEETLLSYKHIDDAHLIRYTSPLKVLAWLGNDALAKDDLLMQAEAVRLTYCAYPNAPSGDSIVIGMYKVSQFVEQFPGQGAKVHRAMGWAIETVASAYAVAPLDWRRDLASWCDKIVDLLESAQDSCTGVLGSNPNLNQFDGKYRTRQSISESILENALWCLRRTVYADRRPETSRRIGDILIRSGYAMVSDMFWNATHGQPHFYVALGPYDATQPPFCSFVPRDGFASYENYQGWATLAYAYRLTRDGLFLDKALEMAQGNIEKVPSFGSGYLQNAAPLIALFQELGL